MIISEWHSRHLIQFFRDRTEPPTCPLERLDYQTKCLPALRALKLTINGVLLFERTADDSQYTGFDTLIGKSPKNHICKH